MRKKHCVIIGAGITGAAAAHYLSKAGRDEWRVTVYEQEAEVGGQLRSASLHGIRYEPHGVHIAHTSNEQARKILEPYGNGYRHEVKTSVECQEHGSHLLTWPLQLSDLASLPEWKKVAGELDNRPLVPAGSNFEDYAVSLMGPTLYEWCCYGYTLKQWGREPRTLSASFAPKRLDLRSDDNPEMFRDDWQGWCDEGWQELVQQQLAWTEVRLSEKVTTENLPGADAYIITAALDDFIEGARPLPWRGVRLAPRFIPELSLGVSQPAPVINTPGMGVEYTRIIEFRQLTFSEKGTLCSPLPGILLCYEYPGASARHYPVDDAAGSNRAEWQLLASWVKRHLPAAQLAGRLATYSYIDMDQAIVQGIHAAQRVLKGSA